MKYKVIGLGIFSLSKNDCFCERLNISVTITTQSIEICYIQQPCVHPLLYTTPVGIVFTGSLFGPILCIYSIII